MNLKFLLVAALSVGFAFGLGAQDQSDSILKTKKDLELFIPRPFRQPVQSMIKDGTQVMDSLDTETPGVKILLYENNTWKYWKDPNYVLQNPVFSENWVEDHADPYRASLNDLPDRISLWIVDTLSDYKCPNITKVYSPFGYRHSRHHQGVDLPLQTGDPVYAAFSGKVRLSMYYHGYGNLIIIRHENGLETFYAHLSKRDVEPGDWVEAGEQIGLGGSTGRSGGPHLHFETRFKGYAFDPQWLIDFESGTLRHRLFVLDKHYLNGNSKYVPENEDEELEIYLASKEEHERMQSEAAAQPVKEAVSEKALAQTTATEVQYYRIRSGDTLSGIAKKQGMSLNKLLSLNPKLSTRTVLKIGQSVRVK